MKFMKTKLIQTKDYLLLVDEESIGIDLGEIGVHMKHPELKVETRTMGGYGSDKFYWSHKKIVAYYPLTTEAKELDLPLLPYPFNTSGKELAVKYILHTYYQGKPISNSENREFDKLKECFLAGYETAKSIYSYAIEDLEDAYYQGRNDSSENVHHFNEFIQSLPTHLPREFVITYNYQYLRKDSCIHCDTPTLSDKQNFCHNCGKEMHEVIGNPTIITNSEGKEVLVGMYKY